MEIAMKTISDYTIYCTEDQTKKAFELGAPIEGGHDINIYDESDESYLLYAIPSAEQLIGYLEEQEGIYDIHLLRTADGEWKYDVTTKCVSDNKMYGICRSRKEATLAAIDAALEYLINNKK